MVTVKQIVGNLPTICLSVFDHFMNLALKGIRKKRKILYFSMTLVKIKQELRPAAFFLKLKAFHLKIDIPEFFLKVLGNVQIFYAFLHWLFSWNMIIANFYKVSQIVIRYVVLIFPLNNFGLRLAWRITFYCYYMVRQTILSIWPPIFRVLDVFIYLLNTHIFNLCNLWLIYYIKRNHWHWHDEVLEIFFVVFLTWKIYYMLYLLREWIK